MSVNFASWVLKQHLRDDRIGDLARDARQDPNWPGKGGISVVRSYLESVTDWDAVFETVDAAWVEFKGSAYGLNRVSI